MWVKKTNTVDNELLGGKLLCKKLLIKQEPINNICILSNLILILFPWKKFQSFIIQGSNLQRNLDWVSKVVNVFQQKRNVLFSNTELRWRDVSKKLVYRVHVAWKWSQGSIKSRKRKTWSFWNVIVQKWKFWS